MVFKEVKVGLDRELCRIGKLYEFFNSLLFYFEIYGFERVVNNCSNLNMFLVIESL